MHPMQWRTLAALLLLASAVALGGCGGKGKEGGQGKGGKGGAPATVTTTVLAPKPWSDSLEALGTAAARESVTITAKVSEKVDQVHFDSGDTVRAGQVLVTLSDRAQSAGVGEAEADYKEAQKTYERMQQLAAKQLVAATQLDVQRANRDAARARLDAQRATVGDRVIVAPFAGVLGLRQVSPGSLVTPGTVVTTLDDTSKILLDFSVPERSLAALHVGGVVRALSDAYPGETFEGRITSVGSLVDSATRALAARAEFDNPQARLRPGMLLNVQLEQNTRQALQVPELALDQLGEQSFLYRVVGDKVEHVPVKIGARRPGWVEILGGVQAGDRVVVEGLVKLKDGQKIIEAGNADQTARADAR
jgi:membrane fusion protein (multidrug efflux system)